MSHTTAQEATPAERYLLVDEVARILRMAPTTVRKRLKDGDLPGVKIGGEWRVPTARLEALLNGDDA